MEQTKHERTENVGKVLGNLFSACAPVSKNLSEINRGEVPEWSNGAVSKTVEPLRVPRVRIPVSPPP